MHSLPIGPCIYPRNAIDTDKKWLGCGQSCFITTTLEIWQMISRKVIVYACFSMTQMKEISHHTWSFAEGG